jgi:ATP-dependent exoDNAse (exonuclease V) beta subunit
MFTWLERGLADSEGGDVSEFLIAPIQPKGEDAGHAKKWVDAVKRKRETQEMRRLLYVAATRAREALHLFARPRFSIDKTGEYKLATPTGNLLATAWPAVEAEVVGQFADWVATVPGQPAAQTLETVAAGADLLKMSEPAKSTLVLRLPADFRAPDFPLLQTNSPTSSIVEPLYARSEGGLLARLEGSAIHSLLERLARLRQRLSPDEAAGALADSLPAVAAEVRAAGLPSDVARSLAANALAVVRRAATDPDGAWILAPHPQAASETAWTGLFIDSGGHRQQRSLRPDRVFLAPDRTQTAGEPVWWIVDYKSSHAPGSELAGEAARAAFLSQHRKQFQEQLQAYARLLRALLPGSKALRAGLYYPRLPLFDSWEV